MQQAYEALRAGGSGSAGGGSDHPSDRQRQKGREEHRAAWQRFWQQPRTPQRIPSKTEELDSTRFYRRVLLSERRSPAGGGHAARDGGGGAAGLPWLIQVYSDLSTYCRVLSAHWEAAAAELAGLAQLGRINFDAQPMLVSLNCARHSVLPACPCPAQPPADVQCASGARPACRRSAGACPTMCRPAGPGRTAFPPPCCHPSVSCLISFFFCQVRFLDSRLRLFSGPHPARELPMVVGFPTGCSSMACARVFRGTFAADSLRQFAGQQLLRLPPVPAISPRLLAAWRRVSTAADPDGGGVALLALLPEGPQPLELLAAVTKARGQIRAAAAVWR